MKVSIKDITEENINEIPEPCKTCLYWENPTSKQGREPSQTEKVKYEAEKATWFLKTLEEFGNCGKIMFVDSKPVGYAQYSTANRLPNIQEYGAKKLGTAKEGVVFISCLYISDESFRGKGLGERLLDIVVTDLKTRFQGYRNLRQKGLSEQPFWAR